ncbi:Calx-beta domain-containing protein, partial [Pedobacter sp. BMA]|uniref:Calx-beta domain-containing protein n=1 Tax=Pedobacter sp. BMA TaxID=1663685 RepID=UPI00064A6BC1
MNKALLFSRGFARIFNRSNTYLTKKFVGYFLRTSLFAFLALISNFNEAFADGSKDLYPSGVAGNRAALYSSVTTFGAEAYPFKTAGTHFVYANAGEIIAVASSAQGYSSGTINIFAPNNITPAVPSATSGVSTTTGRIGNRTQEKAGPWNSTNTLPAGRYRPYEYIAPVSGIYRVEFIPPAGTTNTNTQTNGREDVLADADWTQGTNAGTGNTAAQANGTSIIAAWDVSVRANTNASNWIAGRVYVNVLNLLIDGDFTANTGFQSSVYVLTKDGRAYLVNNNDNKGIGFTFFVNNKGFRNAANNSQFKSVNTNLITSVTQDPRTQDGTTDITHKIFYTKPAPDLPATASINYTGSAATTTWLKTAAILSVISDVQLTGDEGTVGQAGAKGGKITFTSNNAGTYKIVIPPSIGTERILTGNANIGSNTVIWDGKDGDGNFLAPGTTVSQIRVRLQTAEVHFPFIDMEINPKGLIIELLENGTTYNPVRTSTDPGVYSDIVFWNDSLINRATGDERSVPLYAGTNGISSNANGHKWGSYSADAGTNNTNTGKGANSFGNLKSMDTWAFTQSPEAVTSVSVVTTRADLRTNSITPSFTAPVAIGSTVSYTVVVQNFRDTSPAVNSVSDVTGAGFNFTAPAGFSITNVARTLGTGVTENSPVTSGSTYNSKLNMTSGSTATFVITGTVGTSLAGNTIPVQASMLRPADTTDPDATNSTSGLAPTDPAAECNGNTPANTPNPPNRPYGCNNVYADNSVAVVNYVSVSTSTPTLTEGGNAGSYIITIQNARATDTTVPFTMSGAATNGTDYNTIGASAVILAGQTSVTVPFIVIDDAIVEASEAAILTLTAASNGLTLTPVVANRSATITITDNDVDLAVAKTVSSKTPLVGTQVTFTVTASNVGGSAATGVTVTDLLQSGFTLVTASPSLGTYTPSSGVWNVGALAASGTATLTITASVNIAGGMTNIATIAAGSGQIDQVATNNRAVIRDISPTVSTNCTTPIFTINNGFDDPVVANNNNNNIQASATFNLWTTQSGQANRLNIIKVDGTGYTPGPDYAHNGNQYLDINGTSDYPIRTIILSKPSILSFSGWFSNRDKTSPGYADWTGLVEIRNQANTATLASSSSVNFTNATDDETWFFVSGKSAVLPAGTYTYRAFVGDFGHFDDAFACALEVPTVDLTRTTTTVTEGTLVTYRVTLNGTAGLVTENAISVNTGTTPGTAVAADYGSPSVSSVSFPAGSVVGDFREFTILITDDSLVEPNETFSTNITGLTGSATLGTATASTTITDNDTATINLTGPTSVRETVGTAQYAIVLTGTPGATLVNDVTLNYSASNGSAISPADYSLTPGSVTFTAGTVVGSANATKTFNVTIVSSPNTVESTENYTVNISSGTIAPVTLGTTSVITDIIDNALPTTNDITNAATIPSTTA